MISKILITTFSACLLISNLFWYGNCTQVGACPTVSVPTDTLDDLSDGVAIFEILNDMYESSRCEWEEVFPMLIVTRMKSKVMGLSTHNLPCRSDEFFDLSNIRRNARDNAKLKERNLKLLTDGIRDYYSDVCGE